MIKRRIFVIALIFVVIFTSFLSFQTVSVNAESYQLSNGDTFIYNYERNENTYTHNLFMPDENKESYAFNSIYFSKDEHKHLRAFNVTNTNISSTYIEVLDVQTGHHYYSRYWNNTYYKWNSNGWYEDNLDESYDIIYTTSDSGNANYMYFNNYTNLVFDPTFNFGISTFISQETRTYIVNGEIFTLLVDVYYSKLNECEDTWNFTIYGVETTVHIYNYDEYYYYVDNNTGILLEFKKNYHCEEFYSFYEYLSDYNTYVNFTHSENRGFSELHTLTRASRFYSTSDNSFVPYFIFKDYNWDKPITNSTTGITFPLQFSKDVVKMEFYVRNSQYVDWLWNLVDSQTITGTELNYTAPIEDFEYLFKKMNKEFKIIVYDAKGNFFVKCYSLEDRRYPIPEWQSQIETSAKYKMVEDKELVLKPLYIYSDTTWKVETRFYYNQSDLTQFWSNTYESYGNRTIDLWIGGTLTVGDYTVNITFTDAVNTTYSEIVPVTIYPSGTDVDPPSLNVPWYEEKDIGKPHKWVIGDYEEFWFETWDDNPNYYKFYIDGVLYDTENYSEQIRKYYTLNDLINEVGLHNLTVITYDQSGNYRKESFWLKAYPEGTDVKRPGVESTEISYYELGSAERFTFKIFEQNPDYYEIKLNGEIISSGNYNRDNFEIFFTGKELFNETGINILTLFANDTSGKVGDGDWQTNVVPSQPELDPPTFENIYDVDYYRIGDDYDFSFYINDKYPDTYNLYINGNLTLSNVPYEGYGWYPENEQHLQLRDYIFEEGTYEIYIEAFDQWGNNNNITIYVNAYNEAYQDDYDAPQIDTNMDYWHAIEYVIGTSKTVKFTLYDANPDYYELYIDDELIKTDSYTDGSTISFNLNTYITEEGVHSIKMVAYDVFGNSNELKLSIKAVYESSSSGDTNETTSQDKQTLDLPFSIWSIFIALPVITIIAKKFKKYKT
ncbi:MAG: hypothetical protein K9W46_13935 [Candidatus Heimdallarchaeum endolithica]|uniref:Ig-like domain-containing protein n=1 Tax=Candidatus Heimdallarchaeum endolithica TaxID=2876572 RepID=A0A9Y1BQM9_9ARCH|nr:MAG: hypothetical protein K9W46_13935 [Candidatus Heimdallarchaeum endolithica]